jgi:hypothetical protein
MKLPQSPQNLTAAEFNAALKEAGFGVEHARIIDVSGRCPGFVTTAAFRGRALEYPSFSEDFFLGWPRVMRPWFSLAKAIRERDAEIGQRTAVSDP